MGIKEKMILKISGDSVRSKIGRRKQKIQIKFGRQKSKKMGLKTDQEKKKWSQICSWKENAQSIF